MADLGLSAILGGLGSLVSGVSGFMAANAQSKINEYNAKLAEDNARRTIERSQVEQEEQDLAARGFLGEQMASLAASGTDVGTGSALRTRVSARELARKDALNIRQAGEIEAYNYKTQAAGERMQGQATKAQGAFSLIGGFLNAGTSIAGATKTSVPKTFTPTPYPKTRMLV